MGLEALVTIYSEQLGKIIHSYTKLHSRRESNPEPRPDTCTTAEDTVHLSMTARRKQLEKLTLQQVKNLTRRNGPMETSTPTRLK
jgi:hypothetical protein